MNKRVSVREIFDTNPFSPYQVWVGFLCFCITFFEGFDLMITGVTLPSIAAFLHSKPTALGLAVSAGLVGPLVGAIFLGPLADRWGRKKTLVISAIGFGVFTAMTASIANLQELALFRFLAGVGLGGAIPNSLAFGSEFAPTRMRATLATTMYSGVAVGSVIAGIAAAYLLPAYGWQSLYFVGGILPAVIGVLLIFGLPETLDFLIGRGKGKKRILRVVSRIAPALAREEGIEFYSTEKKLPGVPVKHLFMEGRAFSTIMIWALFVLIFFITWFLMAWSPTLLKKSGATVQQFSIAFACINLGSVFATLLIGRLMDKTNPFNLLKVAFILAFVFVVAFGFFSTSPFTVVAVVSVITGFFVFSCNSGLMALATISYPADIRGSGIGWAYAVGKVGSLVAPTVGGLLLAQNLSVIRICSINALAPLLGVPLLIILHRHLKSRAKDEDISRATTK
jgi:AAHS family 4-hydroxybenzoate transporter-like MFS transporter